ncbi:hypothetical protein Tco_1432628 [Tanacetum coccineum]
MLCPIGADHLDPELVRVNRQSIHKMLKDGIDTWAPKLPAKRVITDYPLLDEEMPLDLLRLLPIGYTLMSILEYSEVDVTIRHPMDGPKSFEFFSLTIPPFISAGWNIGSRSIE